MNDEELTITAIKANIYDQLVLIENAQRMIQVLNGQLNTLQSKAETKQEN